MEKQVNYKQTGRKLPYPRVEWKCQECGFLLCICEGYNMDYRSNDYGKLVYPTGKCLKCKGEIAVGKSSDESSGLHLQNVNASTFEEVVRPLMKYMAENHHPHTNCIVTGNTAEISEGIKCLKDDQYLVD